MSNLTENQLLDYRKWYLDTPEEGFSPERNKQVIEKTIKKSELIRQRRNKDYIEQIRERSDAVVTFLRAVDRGREPNIDRYFGRTELARLRGQRIVEEIQGRARRLLSLD